MNCFDCLSSAEDRTGKNTSSPMWSSSQHPETASKTVIEWNRNTDGVRLTKETTVENYCQSISQAFIPFGDTRLSFQQGRNYWQYLSVKALLLWDFPSCPDIKKNEFIMVIDSRQNGKKKKWWSTEVNWMLAGSSTWIFRWRLLTSAIRAGVAKSIKSCHRKAPL